MHISDFFYNSRFWLLRHLLFWIFFYLDEFLSLFGLTEPIVFKDAFLGFSFDLFVVYFNLYYLIPNFFNKDKIGAYILSTTLSVLVSIAIVEYITYDPSLYDEPYDLIYFLIFDLVYTFGLLGFAVAIKISKINFTKQEELIKLKEIKHAVEVDNLKKQINPHFLFNVLNNIYVQSRESPKEVPDTILKLSDLMRYQTYDSSKERVALQKEIDFIQQYIDFECMRQENLQVDFNTNEKLHGISIPPLLFLPFVENACKHSASTESQPASISISCTRLEDIIQFECTNSIGNRNGYINDTKYSGFGLDNVKKRLQLLFPNKHDLKIVEENATFKVHLEIEI